MNTWYAKVSSYIQIDSAAFYLNPPGQTQARRLVD